MSSPDGMTPVPSNIRNVSAGDCPPGLMLDCSILPGTDLRDGAATGRVQGLPSEEAIGKTCDVITLAEIIAGGGIAVGDTDAEAGASLFEAHGDTFQQG